VLEQPWWVSDQGVILNVSTYLNDNELLSFLSTCRGLASYRQSLLSRLLPLPEILDVSWAWLWGRRYNLGPPPPPVRWVCTLYKNARVENERVKCISSCRSWMNSCAALEHMEAFRLLNKSHEKECHGHQSVQILKEHIAREELKRKAEEDVQNIKRRHAAEKRSRLDVPLHYLMNLKSE